MSEELIPRLGLRELQIQHKVDSYRFGINEADPKSIEAYGREFVKEVMPNFERKMCATCADCKHKQGQSEAYMSHKDMELVARAVVGCSKATLGSDGILKLRSVDPYCPDGFNLSTRLWVEPSTVKSGETSWGEPVKNPRIFVVEQEAPFSEELQNHLTKPQLEEETRKKVFDMLAAHDPSKGLVTPLSCREYLEQEKQYRKEEFFGPGGKFAVGGVRVSGPETPAMFRDEYQTKPRAYANDFVSAATKSSIAQRDIPQGPDVGTW